MQNAKKSGNEKYMHRSYLRKLLIFYDFLVLCFSVAAVYIVSLDKSAVLSSFTARDFLIHGLTILVCCFVPRFIFDVYREILRYGNMGAIARLLAADAVGFAVYFCVDLFVFDLLFAKKIEYMLIVLLVLVNLVLSVFMRLIYIYMYSFAQKKNAFGKFMATVLSVLGRTDVFSKEIGHVLTFGESHSTVNIQPINDLQKVCRHFEIEGHVNSILQIENGYVNQTYHVTTVDDKSEVHHYLLQRINTTAFPEVEKLMNNYEFVTNHLKGMFSLPGSSGMDSTARIRPCKTGEAYLKTDTGYWRMQTYFTNVYSLDIPDSPETFYHAGKAFGSFIKAMSDVSCEKLHIVIPDFHNTVSRYEHLLESIKKDPVSRVSRVSAEIEFLLKRKNNFGIISNALDKKDIPTRICHNDCNMNNILFDNITHLPVAIIDLDTVMPSSPLYDYGDSMRAGTNTARDDETDLSRVSCNLNLYEKYAKGFLEACGDMLTKEELMLLPYASLVITAEDSIRFLMDYIDGDVYYNVYYNGQNLDRARNQMKLLSDMEEKLPQICGILQKTYDNLGLDVTLSDRFLWKVNK